jgi:hypothetical protein
MFDDFTSALYRTPPMITAIASRMSLEKTPRQTTVSAARSASSTRAREIEHRIDLAQQMIGRNLLIEVELVEKLILRS